MLAKANDREEDMEACLKALGEMRWAFCKRATRIQTVRGVYAGVRQAKEVRARREEEERRRQNAQRATIPSRQSYNTSIGFSPQQAYAPNQAQPQPSGPVNIHRYLMSSMESYPQLAPPIQSDAVLPANVDLLDTSPSSQPSAVPSKDESINGTRMTLPATHSPSSASEHSEPAELPQSYYDPLPPFASAQPGLLKTQPIPYPSTLTSQQTPLPHQQRSTSAQSLGHSETRYPTQQQPLKPPPRYSPQQPYSLQQQLYSTGVAPGPVYPASVGPSMAPPSLQSVDTQIAFAGPSSAQSSMQPSPGSSVHADRYGGIPDTASSAARLQTKFDMDVADWMSTLPYAQYQTQAPIQRHYPPQPMVPSQHSQPPRGHGMYPPNSQQNPQLHGTQMHPQYSHAHQDYFYSGQ